MKYNEQLQDQRWQDKRWAILERDDFECRRCYENMRTLQVHHLRYYGHIPPWDYEDKDLITLCDKCHKVVGIDTSENETNNPWITYENIKRHIPKDMHPKQYEGMIGYLCERINV